MIEIKNLTYKIREKIILSNINLSLPDEKLIALIGPNGAGKSTLLSLMARLIPLQEGKIIIDNKDLLTTTRNVLAKTIAIFQQQSDIKSRLKVKELVMMARFPYHKGRPQEKDKKIVAEMLELFSLTEISERFLDNLSGGQRQRALAAMVFAQDTPTILLDEPLNNLDMRHAKDLMEILRRGVELNKKRIVLVLHDVNYAAKYADFVVAMKNGEINFSGNCQEVLSEQNLQELYQIPVSVIKHQGQNFCFYY